MPKWVCNRYTRPPGQVNDIKEMKQTLVNHSMVVSIGTGKSDPSGMPEVASIAVVAVDGPATVFSP
jgi:hypothetical protein